MSEVSLPWMKDPTAMQKDLIMKMCIIDGAAHFYANFYPTYRPPRLRPNTTHHIRPIMWFSGFLITNASFSCFGTDSISDADVVSWDIISLVSWFIIKLVSSWLSYPLSFSLFFISITVRFSFLFFVFYVIFGIMLANYLL